MKFILLLSLILFNILYSQTLTNDSLLLNKNLGFNLRTGILPQVLNNNINGDKLICLSYGIGLTYSMPLKKTKSFYFDLSVDGERGLQKFSTNDVYNSLPRKTETTNYLNYINIGVGLKYVYKIKKDNFLFLSINQSLSYLIIAKQKYKSYENATLTNDITSHNDIFKSTNKKSFAFPLYPELGYVKTYTNFGFKLAGGVKLLTHDGIGSVVYSRILPYMSFGILLIKK